MIFGLLNKYTESAITEAKIVKGYGVRLTMPGYLDATDWEVFDNLSEAREHARRLHEEQSEDSYEDDY